MLLVEDEMSILNLGKAVLERFGYTVLAARTPGEALTMAERYESPIHLQKPFSVNSLAAKVREVLDQQE